VILSAFSAFSAFRAFSRRLKFDPRCSSQRNCLGILSLVQLLLCQFRKIRQHFVVQMKAERQRRCSTRLRKIRQHFVPKRRTKSGSTSFQKRPAEIRQHFVPEAACRNPAALRSRSGLQKFGRTSFQKRPVEIRHRNARAHAPPRVKVLAGRQARAGEQQDHGRQARALIFPSIGGVAPLILSRSGCPPAGKPALEAQREHRRHARLCTSPCTCGCGGVVSC
jgi:hypothetical protein